MRKKIKLSNRNFVPSENLMNLINNPPPTPLHEASYNNIFQENLEAKPMKPLKRNEKNKGKKLGFKKQQFFNNNNNNNQPQQYYNMAPFYNNTLSVNNFNFEPSQPPPLNYGMMPPPPPLMNYQFMNTFYNNLNINNYPPQPQQQMFFMGYGNNCDFYNRFASMKIGTPMNLNVETGDHHGQEWNGEQGYGEDNEGKKRNGFVKKSKYMKSKIFKIIFFFLVLLKNRKICRKLQKQ